MVIGPRDTRPLAHGSIAGALDAQWPETAFTVTLGLAAVNVTWTDGPGQRAVLTATRLAGGGVRAVAVARTLTPVACAGFSALGVTAREAVNLPAPAPDPFSELLSGLLLATDGHGDRWVRGRHYAAAFIGLDRAQLDIALVLARESPTVDPREVAAVARSLAGGHPAC